MLCKVTLVKYFFLHILTPKQLPGSLSPKKAKYFLPGPAGECKEPRWPLENWLENWLETSVSQFLFAACSCWMFLLEALDQSDRAGLLLHCIAPSGNISEQQLEDVKIACFILANTRRICV